MILKLMASKMILSGGTSSRLWKHSGLSPAVLATQNIHSVTKNSNNNEHRQQQLVQGGSQHTLRRMFSVQQSLPHLPVPPLKDTMDKFLTTVKPLYPDDMYQHAEKLVSEFQSSVGPQLQSLLEDRAKKHVNWLESWWVNTAYLDYRYPCAIHVNPGITVPFQNFSGQEQQLRFAARWIAGVLDYKVMIDQLTLPVEYMGKDPLCMKQFYMILNACRIPGKKRDKFVMYPPDQPNPPTHIIVLHNNHVFSVDVFGSDGSLLSVDQIEKQLQQIVSESRQPGPPIGILTADNRNVWGSVYDRLCNDSDNRHAFETIHRGIFVMCLDQPIPHTSPEHRNTVVCNQMNHGGGTQYNSCNRWFDKTIQFIVGSDGAVGVNYEHSSAEGPPIISIVNHVMGYLEKGELKGQSDAPGFKEPKKLRFNLDQEIDNDFNNAMHSIDATIDDLDLVSLVFKDFGKNFIKSQKLSPDAFIQVAYQLAYHRLYNKNAPTYESVSLRRFQHGRTETIRSCTQASDRYCRAMLDPSVSDTEKAKLLREAINAHKSYTIDAMNGMGIDRHLLGLKLTAIEKDFNVPEFFMDPVYTESCHWRLSTSQVASNFDALLCFGPVVPDGYGICYNPMPDHINCAVSAWKICADTDAQTMCNSISQSLRDGRDLLLKTQQAKL